MTPNLSVFRKIKALHDRTDHPGERAAAAAKMQTLASKAGLTVEAAVSILDKPKPTTSAPSFADIFDTSFFRETMAERDRERAQRWREVLAEYRSEEAVFAPGPCEQALEAACERFTVTKETTGWRIGSLWGWDGFSPKDPAPEIVAAVEAAYPMPASVAAAWAEFLVWDKLGRDREARGMGWGDHSPPVSLRAQLIERLLNTMPAGTLDDIRARLSWMDWLNDLESAPDPAVERARLATLRADVEWLAVQVGREAASGCPAADPLRSPDPASSRAVHSGHVHRSTADKRRDVAALLGQGFTDREIARRVGVSPSTVGAVRRDCA